MSSALGEQGQLRICFHGTTAENAEQILRVGFLPGTYFASHLEDAMEFGGTHVFEVAFPKSEVPDYWEFIKDEAVGADRIVSLTVHAVHTITSNEALRKVVCDSNCAPTVEVLATSSMGKEVTRE